MKFYKSSLFFGFLSTIPWLLASTGVISILENAYIFLTVSIMSIVTIFIVAMMHYFSTSKNIIYIENSSQKNNLLRTIFFYVIVCGYTIQLFTLVGIIIQFNFDFAAIRYYFFRGQDYLEVFYGGNKYIKMFFNHILSPLAISSIITLRKWGIREIFIVILYCLNGIAIGGRIELYETFVILTIQKFFNLRKIIFNKNYIAVILFFLILVTTIHINRLVNHLQISSFDALKMVLGEIYAYHSIQFGIISESLDAPMQYGPITGLLTPLYVILGKTSPEGELYVFLDEVEFSWGDRSFNAFGTSIMFFFPLFQWISVPIFFISFWLLCCYVTFFAKKNSRLALSKFLIYSLFFSGFKPYIFSFSWWLCIPLIYVYTFEFTNMRKKNDRIKVERY